MRFRALPTLLILGAMLLFVVPSAVAFYTDWLWFRQLGYDFVFLRRINAQAIVFALTFVAAFVFLYVNLRIARRTLDRPHVILGTGVDGRAIAVEGKSLTALALPVAAFVALSVGLTAASRWLDWLTFFQAVPFDRADALFGRDVSFYVYKLPVYQLIRQQALLLSVLALIGGGVYYVLSGSFVIELRPGGPPWPSVRLVPSARRHLALLGALVFLLMAWGAWLGRPETLLSDATATVGFGASYVDVHARLPFLWAELAVLLVGAVLAVRAGFSRTGWPVVFAVAAWVVVSSAGGLYGAFLQRFVVTPSEQNQEEPFIRHNIEATRAAWALDRVEERELSGDAELTADAIVRNAGTIENVRLWDHQPLLQTFGQIQEIRTYYDFTSVDNDRYMIDGKYRQVMLSAREMNSDSLQNPSWVNERLTYTHGYGLTLGPVNEVTTEGLPVLFIRDLPPVSTVDLRISEPSIYFGELTRGYVLVRTKQPEFHYPQGDDNETTYYEGQGGVPVGDLMRRLLFAIRFGSTDILFTPQITPESRIMFHRQIVERVKEIAPFLTLDSDPYPVVSDGRIFWIQDAYTTTRNYPYATPVVGGGERINYMRNAVKVVIDAFNGDVRFYLAEPTDPLALTLANVFPGLLHPLDEMPEDLRRHVRYPEDLFRIQSQVYTTYHMTNPLVFYNKEDQWQVPTLDGDRNVAQMQPYYTIMRLPGETRSEFIQMLPFTPRLKNNLAAWMVARSDGADYGKLVVFQFPKQKIVYGPQQIIGRINQDQTISPQITLWNQQGSQVIWGTLLVIPIEESLLYVRPLYLRSPEGRIPELKRVIVAYQNRIVMAETLKQAVAEIFGAGVLRGLSPDRLDSGATSVVPTPANAPEGVEAPPDAAAAGDATLAALAAEADDHLQRALAAQRAGDWALYGEEIRKVGEILARMKALR
ncbi:MAG: UPF0182 family protein [Vicinamibacterales bacterium]